MKKLLSILLCVLLLLTPVLTVCAAAENESGSPGQPLVIVRGMDFDGLYVNYGEENERNTLVTPGFRDIFSLVLSLLFTYASDKTLNIDAALKFTDKLLGSMACDKNGDSLYSVGYDKYPLPVSNYPDLLAEATADGASGEVGIIGSAIEAYGADNVYYFTYDWRLDPLDTADSLNETIERAKSGSGSDKVDIICCSMGGIVTDSYIYKYGYDNINKCVFNSSTFCGTYVTGDLFQGKVIITGDMLKKYLGNFIGGNFLLKLLSFFGVFDAVADLAMDIVDNYKDYIYDNFLRDVFVTMPSLWAIVQPEEYEASLEYMFPTQDIKNEYSGLISRADRLQEMVRQMDGILLEMQQNGVDVAVVASYDTQMIPVYESAVLQSDGTLDAALMFGRATVSVTGETLGDDYKAKNPEHLSPDNCVDLSEVLFPEYTWAIKGSPHVGGAYHTDMGEFIMWLLTYDGQPTVNSNEKYPQFMISSGNQELSYF